MGNLFFYNTMDNQIYKQSMRTIAKEILEDKDNAYPVKLNEHIVTQDKIELIRKMSEYNRITDTQLSYFALLKLTPASNISNKFVHHGNFTVNLKDTEIINSDDLCIYNVIYLSPDIKDIHIPNFHRNIFVFEEVNDNVYDILNKCDLGDNLIAISVSSAKDIQKDFLKPINIYQVVFSRKDGESYDMSKIITSSRTHEATFRYGMMKNIPERYKLRSSHILLDNVNIEGTLNVIAKDLKFDYGAVNGPHLKDVYAYRIYAVRIADKVKIDNLYNCLDLRIDEGNIEIDNLIFEKNIYSTVMPESMTIKQKFHNKFSKCSIEIHKITNKLSHNIDINVGYEIECKFKSLKIPPNKSIILE